MMTDPIADMLTRIRNALLIERPFVEIPSSKLKNGLAAALQREGYIWDYEVVELFPLTFPEEADAATYSPPVVDLNSLWVDPNDLPPGFYYLYAPGQ